jgi:hypothetical protein
MCLGSTVRSSCFDGLCRFEEGEREKENRRGNRQQIREESEKEGECEEKSGDDNTLASINLYHETDGEGDAEYLR